MSIENIRKIMADWPRLDDLQIGRYTINSLLKVLGVAVTGEIMRRLKVWTDGGARGNPGPAGIGVHIVEDDVTLVDLAESVGLKTNNQAEYLALVTALRWLAKHIEPQTTMLQLFADSELLVYQVQGRYKVKNIDLRVLHRETIQALESYESFTITPIPREENQIADRLVNAAIDAAAK